MYRFERATGDHQILHQRAVQGVWNLLHTNNVSVEHMTPEDWNYLSSLTAAVVPEDNAERQNLDQYVQQKLDLTNLLSELQNT